MTRRSHAQGNGVLCTPAQSAQAAFQVDFVSVSDAELVACIVYGGHARTPPARLMTPSSPRRSDIRFALSNSRQFPERRLEVVGVDHRSARLIFLRVAIFPPSRLARRARVDLL
jgi:hypothetical protein